jgi:hypothetical protein
MLDAGTTHGDQGKFGGDEESVGKNEGDNGGEGKRGTNGTVLTEAGATGPGTRGDPVAHAAGVAG